MFRALLEYFKAEGSLHIYIIQQ